MTAKESINFIGKNITIYDKRTGHVYNAKVADARTSWGKIQVQLANSNVWFEPNWQEVEEINYQIVSASA